MNTGNSISKRVGSNLKKLRIEAGFTAFQLAEILGMKNAQQLQSYEKGINEIGIAELVAALRVLDADISQFFNQLDEALIKCGQHSHHIEPQSSTLNMKHFMAPELKMPLWLNGHNGKHKMC